MTARNAGPYAAAATKYATPPAAMTHEKPQLSARSVAMIDPTTDA